MNSHRPIRAWLILPLVVLLCWSAAVRADRPGWKRQEVDWRVTGGDRIKAISYPKDKPVPTLNRQMCRQRRPLRKKALPPAAALRLAPFAEESATEIFATVIDSPPIDGFVPWIATVITDERLGVLEIDAIPTTSVTGDPLPPSNPQSDYAISIFDTGASVHIIGEEAATKAGLSGTYLTSNMIEIMGATASAYAWVSEPIGLFIDGLGAIEPNGLLIDNSGMVGETNVSILVGDSIESPNVPTVVGTPLSVYFTTAVRNDQQITVVRDGNEFSGPDIRFYEDNDPCIPNYSNTISLELRPTGGAAVQYFPNLTDPFEPIIPSTITVLLPAQSLFFFSSVDLIHGDNSAIDKNGFMFDTGAQVTVISEAIAARLALNPNNPDFDVYIWDITGEITLTPGFYIDELKIPALGESLEFTHIPVIMLDVASPEGGTLEGIIGMNLFVEYNFVLRGGGLPDYGGHKIEFEPIPYHIVADIAPPSGDGEVNFLDLDAFAQAWLAIPTSTNWNSKADMVGDATINFLDFTVLADYWQQSIAP